MANDTVRKSATADPNYVIGAQDVLDINVWKEPDVSRTVPVRPDGKISLPLLNDVQAAGLTPAQLAAQITESLKKYVTSPQVTVIVTTINSQRVYILGEVTRPEFPAHSWHVGAAGPFQRWWIHAVREGKEYLFRRMENGKETKYPFNYKEVINGKNPSKIFC